MLHFLIFEINTNTIFNIYLYLPKTGYYGKNNFQIKYKYSRENIFGKEFVRFGSYVRWIWGNANSEDKLRFDTKDEVKKWSKFISRLMTLFEGKGYFLWVILYQNFPPELIRRLRS